MSESVRSSRGERRSSGSGGELRSSGSCGELPEDWAYGRACRLDWCKLV